MSGAGGAGAQTPKRGGTVVYGLPFGEPACFTPFRDECAAGSPIHGFIMGTVLEQTYDVGPRLTWRPQLFSDVDYTTEPPFTLTAHIRPEARWSDGVPITARDVIFTHNAIVRHWPAQDEIAERTKVRSVRPLDRKTVRVVLRSRFAGWRGGLWGIILPAHALAGEDLGTVWRDGFVNPKTARPIGSGAFLMERWERGKQITLVRNPRYWGPHPAYVDRLVVRFQVQGPALREAFRSGELDAASHFPTGFVAELRQERNLRVLSNQGNPGWDHFEIRIGPGGHPALKLKLVRRALAYGIDRAAIVERFLTETVPDAEQRDSAVFPPRSPYYRPNWRIYRHRPAEARRLLERAGCRPGTDGIYVCEGQPLSLDFVTTAQPGGFRPGVVQLAQAQLRQVGVEVVPRFSTMTALFEQTLPGGAFDVALFSWNAGTDAAAAAKTIFGSGGPRNFTGYRSRLLTADLDQAERILDADRQARALNRADARLARDVPVIPLYQQPQSVVVRSTIRNLGLSLATSGGPFWNAENWWLER